MHLTIEGQWVSVIGYRLLVIGYWLLVIGYRLLVDVGADPNGTYLSDVWYYAL
jgi:hypothetical protein